MPTAALRALVLILVTARSMVWPVGRQSRVRTSVDSPGRVSPAAWWWSIAATRRRLVAGAHGQSVRNAMTIPGSAGSGSRSLTMHQSVNTAQSPAYARTVAGANAVAGNPWQWTQ